MASPPQGINLVGPIQGYPLDLQVQEAQAQQAQQLAYALMGHFLQGQQPIIHTGGNNPFARDVVNLAPIGSVIGAMLSGKAIAGENQKQKDLAQQALTQYSQEMQGVYQPALENTAGTPSVMGTHPPTVIQMAQRASMSTNPLVRSFGMSLWDNIAKAALTRQVTPENFGAMIRNASPQSVAASLVPGILGGQEVNYGGVQMKPTWENVPATARGGYANPNTAVQGAGPGAIPSTSGTAASGFTEQVGQVPPKVSTLGGSNVVQTPEGDVKVLQTAQSQANESYLKGAQEEAEQKLADVQDFQGYSPLYAMMTKIALRGQQTGNFGFMGNEINEFRKAMIAAGYSQDQMNKVTDFESFRKMAVPEAAAMARRGVGARVSNIEWNSFLQALGASGDIQPSSMLRIGQQNMINGMNRAVAYEKWTLPRYSAAAGADQKTIKSLSTGMMGKDERLALAQTLKQTYGLPINWDIDPQGWWYNKSALQNTDVGVPPSLPQQIPQ